MDSPESPRKRKALIAPSQEAWAAAFARINTPSLRALARQQLVRRFQKNATAQIDILFPDIARTLAAQPLLSDAELRSYVVGAIRMAISNETQRGTEAGTKKREIPYSERQDLLMQLFEKRARRQLQGREIREEERAIIIAAAHNLNARQKHMLAMALEGKNTQQMAAELRVSLPTFQTAWYRVVKQLKDAARKGRSFHVHAPKKKMTSRKPRRP